MTGRLKMKTYCGGHFSGNMFGWPWLAGQADLILPRWDREITRVPSPFHLSMIFPFPPVCHIPCLSIPSSCSSPQSPHPSLRCPRQCRPAGFDHRAREEMGSGSESCAGDCRETRLEYRVGEQGERASARKREIETGEGRGRRTGDVEDSDPGRADKKKIRIWSTREASQKKGCQL